MVTWRNDDEGGEDKWELSRRSVEGTRLKRGTEDGKFDERHILQSRKGSDELGEEEEAQRTGKALRRGRV